MEDPDMLGEEEPEEENDNNADQHLSAYKSQYKGRDVVYYGYPKGWTVEQEMETMPHWRHGPRRCYPCNDYWMLGSRSKGRGCHRGDRCFFIHSSAHMTLAMKTTISHVEHNMVLSGCPKPQDKNPCIRRGYPAPWLVQGVSHLMADGIGYSPDPQEENWGDQPPRQLRDALEYSKRARLPTGGAPHAPPQAPAGPSTSGPYPWSSTRQAPSEEPLTTAPKEST